MMSSRYPHTSDPETLKAQRVAGLAKSAGATVVVCVIAALATLPACDERRTYDPRASGNAVSHAAADLVESAAPTAAPSGAGVLASDEQRPAPYLDPDAVDDYRATADY